MNTRGYVPSGQKNRREPSSEIKAILHFPEDGKVMYPEKTAPTLVTNALLAKLPEEVLANEMLATVVLLLGRESNNGICVERCDYMRGLEIRCVMTCGVVHLSWAAAERVVVNIYTGHAGAGLPSIRGRWLQLGLSGAGE